MSLRSLSLAAISLLALAACARSPEQSNAVAPRAPSAGLARPSSAETGAARLASTPSPPASEVLEAIFHNPGDRSSSYALGNGSWASYWYGHAYESGGTLYFTGFAEKSPQHEGNAEADDPPTAQAELAQATYKAERADHSWTFVSAQRSVAQVGTRGRADAVDPTRKAVLQSTRDGRLLLAVPTDAAIEQGTVQKNYELLLRSAKGAWSHAGTVSAGSDDSAGCDAGRAFACAPVAGTIAIDAGGEAMPTVRITLTRGGDKGGATQNVTYRYEPSSSTYQPAETH